MCFHQFSLFLSRLDHISFVRSNRLKKKGIILKREAKKKKTKDINSSNENGKGGEGEGSNDIVIA